MAPLASLKDDEVLSAFLIAGHTQAAVPKHKMPKIAGHLPDGKDDEVNLANYRVLFLLASASIAVSNDLNTALYVPFLLLGMAPIGYFQKDETIEEFILEGHTAPPEVAAGHLEEC
jgi:hypothetical protein